MKKKTIFSLIAVLGVAAMGWGIFRSFADNSSRQFEFAEISRGDLESTITSSGTLSPVTTVEVGTQVSGIIDRVFVDFNDVVRKGQLLAVLDTVLLKVSVLDAEAGVARAMAQVEEAEANFKRNQDLYNKALISEAEFLPYQIAIKTQRASLSSAQAALERAQRNLKYAVIRSPISGTVIARNVEAGQTVAASFSTPTLFVIAEDLSKMQILAQVDESDIGQIKNGQAVRFDVQAYPDKHFTGVVRQVRLQPETVSNVVNYTVVVDASNNEKLLLPGMTATVDFITEQKKAVLTIPNTALRFQATDAMLTEFRAKRRKEMEAIPDSVRAQRRGFMGNREGAGGFAGGNGFSNSQRPTDLKQIWYVDSTGSPAMEIVKIGTTDGTRTEIVRNRDLAAGTKVITGIANSTNKKTETTSRSNNPFGGGPGGRPPF